MNEGTCTYVNFYYAGRQLCLVARLAKRQPTWLLCMCLFRDEFGCFL